MSRKSLPKQLLPVLEGGSLLEAAADRLAGLVEPANIWVCSAGQYRDVILRALPGLSPDRFIAEPEGRDTLNAVGLAAIAITAVDPEAVMAVFPADHLIQPQGLFIATVDRAFDLVEADNTALVALGMPPDSPSTSFGYLELGDEIDAGINHVSVFHEKPDLGTAYEYLAAGSDRFLWNCGIFVWHARTLLDYIGRYAPEAAVRLREIQSAWNDPIRDEVVDNLFPELPKISVDYAVMEPASKDPDVRVASILLPCSWVDVGSWPMYARILPHDDNGNAIGTVRAITVGSRGCVIAGSDPNHLVAAIGVDGLVIVHTPDATLVCRADDAEAVKEAYRLAGEQYNNELV